MNSLSTQSSTWQALLRGKMLERGMVQVRRIITKPRAAQAVQTAEERMKALAPTEEKMETFANAVIEFEKRYYAFIPFLEVTNRVILFQKGTAAV